MTKAELFAQVKALGLSITYSVEGDEYRVTLPHHCYTQAEKEDARKGGYPLGYFTGDRDDALDTARAMKNTAVQRGLLQGDPMISHQHGPNE